ncbi:MAG: phosphohistidine phosphatase SixA [Gemmatimonadaceae bacterium]
MKLLVIRHAIAKDREKFAESGESDDLRPITTTGEKKMRRIAKALVDEIGDVDRLATSPLTRAMETARIVADAYGIDDPEVTDSLVPEARPEQFEEWCGASTETSVLGIVGHEPHLGALVTWLLTASQESRILLKKGGACLLEFELQPRRDSGTLLWLLTPAQLRKMARR